MIIDNNNIHSNNQNHETQMDDCEVRVPSTLLDWNTMASFFPWGLLLIRWLEQWWVWRWRWRWPAFPFGIFSCLVPGIYVSLTSPSSWFPASSNIHNFRRFHHDNDSIMILTNQGWWFCPGKICKQVRPFKIDRWVLFCSSFFYDDDVDLLFASLVFSHVYLIGVPKHVVRR